MKKGTSPIKTKIISDFMQKLSGKKEEKVLTSSEDQSVNTSINHEEKPRQVISRQVTRSSQTPTVNNAVKPKNGLEKSIDDILGFGQPISRSKYVPTKPIQQPIQSNPIKQQQLLTKSPSTQHIQPFTVIIEPSDSILEQSARSRNSSTSMKVNNSSMKFINKSHQKFTPSAVMPVKLLNFDEKKQIKVHVIEQNLKESDNMGRDTEIKAKTQEIQNLTKEKAIFVQKVAKLEQDLNRKEKELTRRVNQINSSTLERQVVLNFISNLTQKINIFLVKKQQTTQAQPSKPINYQTSKSLSKSIPQKKRQNSSFSSSKPLSQLQSISQDKQISLIESINVKLLDDLTKSMQKGLSRSQISKKSQELLTVFRRFIHELKKDQEGLVNNIKGQNSKVQKEFENQKQAMNRMQKLYETEKGKYEKLVERQKSLNEQLEQIKRDHNKCVNVHNQLNRQLENNKVSITKLKEQVVKKDGKIQQMEEKLKAYQKLPNQHAQQKQEIKKNYEKLLREKEQQIVSLKRNQEKQIKLKLSQSLTIKQQLSQKQNEISFLQTTITKNQSRITQLQQTITERQSQIKQLTSQLSQFKNNIQKYERQQSKQDSKIESKQKTIQELQLNLVKKQKKIIELEFMLDAVKKQLNIVREEVKGLEINQVNLLEAEAKLKQNLANSEQSNSFNLQQMNRWKSQYEKTSQQLFEQIKSAKNIELSSTKNITKLQFQLSVLQQHNLHLSQKVTQLQQSNLQLELKIVNFQSSSSIEQMKNSQSHSIYKQLAQVQFEKHNLLMMEKEKTWREEFKLLEGKYLSLKEEYWREKDVCERVKLDCENKSIQNLECNTKLKAMNMGLDIVTKRITKITLSSTKFINKTQKTIDNEEVDKIIYLQNSQFAKIIRNTRQQHKKFHQLIKSILQFQINVKKQHQLIQKLNRANQKLAQPILAFNLELVGSAVFQTEIMKSWMNKEFGSIQQSISVLEECFVKSLKSRNKVEVNNFFNSSLIKSLAMGEPDQSNLLNSSQKVKNIDPTILKCFSTTSSIRQGIFPNYLEKLSNLMKQMFSKLDKLSTHQVKQTVQKYQFQIKEMKQDFSRQYIEMEVELNQVKNEVLAKQVEFNKIVERIKIQQYEPKLKSLEQQHQQYIQSLHQQYQDKYQSLRIELNHQLSSKQKSLTSHLLIINSLEHQLTFQKQKYQKLTNQLNELKRCLVTQTEQKSRLSSQLHQTKLSLYQLKEYEQPKWQEKCQELETLLSKKNEQLKQAYLLVQNHLADN